MKVTFIMPCVGRKKNTPYVKSWQMEPLPIAVLAALTQSSIQREFFDDRLEDIDYSTNPDLVAINVETYTAKRAYQIASRFRKQGIPVVMGGFHATLMPDEVAAHADAVVSGAAEPVWQQVLSDLQLGRLQKLYSYGKENDFAHVVPDRSVYAGKKYTDITLIETGRGCRYSCEFCSVTAFFGRKYFPRPIEEVVDEIRRLKPKLIFFIDDNIGADHRHTRNLLNALIPLKIRWVGQVSLDITRDESLLELMRESGCIGVLIGFESLNRGNLEAMGKNVNIVMKDYDSALAKLRKVHIVVYATFMFGYDHDDRKSFEETLDFSMKHRFFFSAFAHLVPFPGTPLFDRMKREKRLLHDRWWLEEDYHFGDVSFSPKKLTPDELSRICLQYRKRFYSVGSIIYRGLDFRANSYGLFRSSIFWVQNLLINGKDVDLRQGLPLGVEHERD